MTCPRVCCPKLEFRRIDERPFEVLGERVTPIPLSHGRFNVFGFRIGDVAYCTDVSAIPERSWPLLEGLDVFVIDALRPGEAAPVALQPRPGAGGDRPGEAATGVPDAHVAHHGLRCAGAEPAAGRRAGLRRAEFPVLMTMRHDDDSSRRSPAPPAGPTGRRTSSPAGTQLSAAERTEFVGQLAAIDLAELLTLARKGHEVAAPKPDEIAPLPVEPAESQPAERARGRGGAAARRGRGADRRGRPGQPARVRQAEGDVPGRAGLGRVAVSDPRREGARARAAVRQAGPVPRDDQPGHGRRHAGVLRGEPLLRPRAAIGDLLPAGHDAGGRCARTGRLLLEKPGRLFLSPNGHGGTLTALAEREVLDELREPRREARLLLPGR